MSESIDWSKTGMEYRHLGRTGLKVSALSLGAWTTYGGTSDQNTCGEVRRRFVTKHFNDSIHPINFNDSNIQSISMTQTHNQFQ